ncbi:substrate-binding domain-containing protein [Aurantimonas sp. C2-6-R+9]|uniref:substrate-binding domain-containing protein n=1 Tax=unclassified Aurantimonas TaxID=2638230 RepID=UPI002E198199|nr:MULTISPECIES: substrate-binding domain-containing protein [unclassified Aurantimonas]MEC5289273.1 substrate-binding domain-containing protein [Aurantimonas sp. C2-3-R2]MEC5324646.1 substrate-binding domain-containing protein [Aurantimonas sp. A3-2-R12]MEC5380091.1 substrate-binding domain-containing protein [Aurantimonas sp. C2-6-R+9]MEC5410277.1 substrate-binding domain-containing protein [Aurantimonas sp. C2-4-R8]
MNNRLIAGLALGTAIALTGQAGAQSRDQIQIVGSSTVFPYTQAVAEQFANQSEFSSPVVESTGTGGGMKIFCEGVGAQTPDITGASRAMKPSEWELCQKNGVTDITEVLLGYDALSLASSQNGPDLSVTKEQLYKALAAEVPVDGEIKANPYKSWNEIDASLPAEPILVYGPPPTSGTRDAWVELVMEEGCGELAEVEALEDDRKAEVCQRMRTDGAFVEAGENDNLIVQRLESDSSAFGIFGYSFLYENQDKLKGAEIGGVTPSETTVESGEYPVSRPLFVYIKNAHRQAIPGLNEFVAEYVSENAMGQDGYLLDRGLVPLKDEKLKEIQDKTVNGGSMEAPQG